MGSSRWLEFDEFTSDRRVRIVVLAALGFAFCVGMYNGVIAKQVERTPGQQAAYVIINLWEAVIFGLGLAFFVIYGEAILRLDRGPLRKRCIGIWLAISYFFISWFPHASVHQFLFPNNPTDYIILEICFHWPNLAAGFVLCFYQFDVLYMTYDVAKNNKTLRGWSEKDLQPTPWYYNKVFHGIIITLVTATGWAMFAWQHNPIPPNVHMWQRVILVFIYITDGVTSGIALGFAYVASFMCHRLPKKRTRVIGAISIVCITYATIIATPHPISHNIVGTDANLQIVLEYTYHTTITLAIAVLAYFQHKFLVLAISGRISMGILKYKTSSTSKTMSGMSADKSAGESSFSSDSRQGATEMKDVTVTINGAGGEEEESVTVGGYTEGESVKEGEKEVEATA